VGTGDVNGRWYQGNTGQILRDIQGQIRHPVLGWMAATLDGRVAATEAVFEAKFMLPWAFSEDAAAEKYMPQLQHSMWVVAARNAVLSVITGGGNYALFTLVGIAGEDDLDAPDLLPSAAPKTNTEGAISNKKDRLNGGQRQSRQSGSFNHRPASTGSKPGLGIEASARLRDQLIAELSRLNSAEEAANWAHRILSDKNSLNAADAQKVEQAFGTKLATLVQGAHQDLNYRPMPKGRKRRRKAQQSRRIHKNVLALPEPRRIRDREHVKAVAKQPCLVCGRRPADAHHLRFAQSRALGRKVSDEFTVPLCRGHHR